MVSLDLATMNLPVLKMLNINNLKFACTLPPRQGMVVFLSVLHGDPLIMSEVRQGKLFVHPKIAGE